MLALGLQGSPRKKGNSDILMSGFMNELQRLGCNIQTIDITRMNIEPCKEISVCETKGFCPIDDDMADSIYPLLREAEIVVIASPIFFYSVSAQLKAVIDRSQALWARKYPLKLRDPLHKLRRGFFLGVGATTGKKLFEGSLLTAKYFFDGIDAAVTGSLTYSGIEKRGQIADHPELQQDIKREAAALTADRLNRHKVLFACRENACRSQMAAAFARVHGGDKLDVASAGSEPAEKVNPVMEAVMAERGIDLAHRRPVDLNTAIAQQKPDEIITMGCREQCPVLPGVQYQDWDLADPADQPIEFMRTLRDDIERKIKNHIENLK